MRKILLFLVLVLNSAVSFSQGDPFGNTPVQGIIPIRRGSVQDVPLPSLRTDSQNSVPSPATPTGSSAVVGFTDGQLSVSLTGGATYDIPIAVPPGINGVVPQVSLSYNSQAGNGLAGYGWNIAGISVISRIPSTRFHDNNIDAVDFDATDRFALDGQRLMIKNGTSGTYGADGTVYETESFSAVQITSYGVHPSGANYGPAYFIVQYPDGSIAHYGNSSTSRSLTDWAITYWQNPQGVRITYNYLLSNNNLSISTISYGTRLTTTPINEIAFIYKTRQRPEQAYIGGQNFIRNTILSEIRVKGNNLGFRNYLLTHGTTTLGYERLLSVIERSGDNSKSLNPTVFNYDTTGEAISFATGSANITLNNVRADNAATVSGDFNGDGNMDFLMYPTIGADAKKKYWLFSDIQGTGQNIGSEHNIGAFVDIFPTSWLNHSDKLMPMQGWCAIQYNSGTNVTSFKNYSTGTVSPIYFQYEKTYEFPRISYVVQCPDLPHCDLSPVALAEKNLQPETQSYNNASTNKDFTLDPVDPLDPGLDPGGPRDPLPVLRCPSPSNVNVSIMLNNEGTVTWTSSGSPAPTMWEVCYFEAGTANDPSNNDPIGTYITTSQTSLNISPVFPRRTYRFFIRSICSSSFASSWHGPVIVGGIQQNPSETRYKVVPKEYVNGDFNGDGLSDVIAIDKLTSYQSVVCQGNCYTNSTVTVPGGKTYFVNLDRRLTDNFVSFSGQITTTNSSKFVVADFNGDGKSDLFVFDVGICRIYGFGASNYFSLLATHTSGNIDLVKPILLGDYNGDGKADFIIPKSDGSVLFTKYFSMGNSIVAEEVDLGIGEYSTGFYDGNKSNTQHIIANDFNNDGKTDIVLTKCNYVHSGELNFVNNNRYISVRYFANKGTTFESTMFTTKVDVTGLNHFPIPISLSFDKANANKQISFISNNNIYSVTSPKDNVIDTRLKEIVMGNGVKEVITYQALDSDLYNYDSAFTPSTYTEAYPNFDMNQVSGFQVVSKLEQVTPSQYKQQKFKYYGAVTNLQGLGFIGFRGIATTNWFNTDNPAVTSVSKYDISKRAATIEEYTILGEVYGNFTALAPTTFINKSTMTYAEEILPNKVYKINTVAKVSLNGLNGTSQEVTNTFDDYGNPLTTTTISKNGTTVERTDIVTKEYDPAATSPVYYNGRLKKRHATVTVGSETTTGEEVYTYNAAHLVSKIQKKGHQTDYLTEDNLYDVYGNITKKTITAAGMAPRVTNFAYDPSGRFLVSSTDVEGLVTSYTYNTSTGLIITQTLPSNPGFPITTTFTYDAWGNKSGETDYLGKIKTYSYFWTNPGVSGNFGTSIVGQDNSASYTRFDELGRKIAEGLRTVSDAGAESNISWKTFTYDIYDKVVKAYEPTLSAAPQWSGSHSVTTYDVYGRPTQVVEHTGKTTNISYNGLTTTTSDGVNTTTIVKNSIGNVVSKNDNGGLITYQYFANGDLKQSNFGGVIVTVEQDGWGRKTKLIDPSAGTYLYEYNGFGEITKETTPKGVTNYVMDNFGKVLEKTVVGTNGDPTNNKTTITYDPATKLITSKRYDDFTGGFFTNYSYQYDNYKRLNFYDESGFNAYYQRAVQFDAFGRPEKELYTAVNTMDGKRSDIWVRTTYKNGHRWQLIDDATGQLLWQTTKVNARGQLQTGMYGNGITVTNTYDQYGYPTQFKHDKTVAPAANVMTLTTGFTAQRGNLTHRINNMFDYREDFTYDNLDRLATWKETGEMLWDCTFNSTVEGFQTVGGASLSLLNGALRVVASGQGKGSEKLAMSNAVAGQKINIKGKATINTAASGTTLRISFYEKDPVTGQMINNTTLGMPINGTFSFGTTVSTYSDIYVKFAIHHTNPSSAFMVYDLDDIKITLEKNEAQAYDDLGRIDENALGTYNYTNTSKPFQNTSIELTPKANQYYLGRSNLEVSYNAFKSPIDIVEEGKDKLSFIYNMNNGRSTMYYGGLQADKLLRPFRKHYSADGTIEVKQNIAEGTVEFITYIGGDAYSAPVIMKSNGTTSQFLYLHRDYLGSIVAVTNQSGAVVEKRLFDAWGNITRVQDGNGNNLPGLTIIDRGYTGHEHLQGVALIHMNARLYDPVAHRFLQPDNYIQDPLNTLSFNRYAYCLNNPLKYTDADGEFWFVAIGAIVGAYLGASLHQGTFNPAKWDNTWWKGAVVGAVVGAYGGQMFATYLASSLAAKGATVSVAAVGGISKNTVFAKMLMATGKAMVQSYTKSIFSFDPDSGFKLDFSLSAKKIEGMLVAGAIAGIGSLTSQGMDLVYKEGKEGLEATGLLANKEWAGKLVRNVTNSTLGGISSNIINGNKGVFEDLTYLKFGNGVIELGEGKKIFNLNKLSKHAMGWAMYGLADDLGFGKTPQFDIYKLEFDYKTNSDLFGKHMENWFKGTSTTDKVMLGITLSGIGGIISTFGLSVKF